MMYRRNKGCRKEACYAANVCFPINIRFGGDVHIGYINSVCVRACMRACVSFILSELRYNSLLYNSAVIPRRLSKERKRQDKLELERNQQSHSRSDCKLGYLSLIILSSMIKSLSLLRVDSPRNRNHLNATSDA